MTQPQERPPLDTEQLIRQADTLRKIVAWADERVDNDGDSEVKHDLEASATALTDAAAELSRLRETPRNEELEAAWKEFMEASAELSSVGSVPNEAYREACKRAEARYYAARKALREIFQRQSLALVESRKEIERLKTAPTTEEYTAARHEFFNSIVDAFPAHAITAIAADRYDEAKRGLNVIFQRQQAALAESRKEIEALKEANREVNAECMRLDALKNPAEAGYLDDLREKAALWDAIERHLRLREQFSAWFVESQCRIRDARKTYPFQSVSDFVRALIEKEPR